MSMTTLQTLSREELDNELSSLKERLHLPLDLARKLRETDVLTAEQYALLNRIDDLEWLRGGGDEQ